MKITADYKKSFTVTSLCYLIVGVVVLLFPQLDAIKICYALGGITIVMGIIYIIKYFTRTDFTDVYRLDFVYGVLLMAGGVYAVARPAIVGKWLYIIIGCAICLDSVIKLQNAIDLKRLNSSLWWAVLIMALITGTISVMLLASKSYSVVTPTQFIGISLIVDGAINIVSVSILEFSINKARKVKTDEVQPVTPKPEQPAEPQSDEKPAAGRRMAFFDMLTNDGADEQDDDD